MKKILFFMHDLSHGGAEKVLVNLLNNMSRDKFDITLLVLFGGGVNTKFLNKNIKIIEIYKKMYRGNSYIMKLFTPEALYKHYVKEQYDTIVSYLEGPCARIVSGCNIEKTKLISWIHIEKKSNRKASKPFRSCNEAQQCYSKFHKIVCVSNMVKADFISIFGLAEKTCVLHNTIESDIIVENSRIYLEDKGLTKSAINICGMGKIVKNKGFDRLAKIHIKLRKEGYDIHTYVLGVGSEESNIREMVRKNGEEDTFKFLGYQENPYNYMSNCDMFVCSSYSEGFSTATTEALILGLPVVSTEVAGVDELLGKNEFGIVTKNDVNDLYIGVKQMLENENLQKYKEMSKIRGYEFNKERTVHEVEKLLMEM